MKGMNIMAAILKSVIFDLAISCQ